MTDRNTSRSASSNDFVERARSLASQIEGDADTIETRGVVTEGIQKSLEDNQLFWMLVPAEYGGGGQGIAPYIATIEELSRADASTGWSFMANSGSIGAAAGFLSDSGVEKLFGGADKGITAGQLAPMGKGSPAEGGFVAGGTFQFGSGSTYATWMGGGFAVMEEGKPRRLPNGELEMRVGFFPRESVEFHGNWNVSGLVGTGSYDYVIPEQFIPDDLTFERQSVVPVRPEPVFALGLAGIAVAGHASVALGLMKRALSEVAVITHGKKRVGYPVPVGEYPVFLQEFARHEASYQAARRYVIGAFSDAENAAAAGHTLTTVERARMRQAATWTHAVASDVVGFCRLWGGTQAFRNPSVLGRVVRDMNVATQHVLIDPVTLTDAGGPILESYFSN